MSFQLRVIRAFKSTLEDLEEKRSEHSIHSLRNSRSHSGLRSMEDDPSVKSASLHAAGEHHPYNSTLTTDRDRDRERDQRHQRNTSPDVHNNNRAASKTAVPTHAPTHAALHVPVVNGHPTTPSSVHLAHSMTPPQMLVGAHRFTVASSSNSPPPPSSVLPIRLDYDSLPDLPADLPRLVHETSI